MEHCVADGHLTFGLAACFAFVILYSSREVRSDIAFDYLTVDEFQDTNGLQMMISLMILRQPNMCAVGDWRQGIYGFRYVSIENIQKFHSRLVHYRDLLNGDGIRRVSVEVPSSPDGVPVIHLDVSFRSSKEVIRHSYLALTLPTHKSKGSRHDLGQEEIDRRMKDQIESHNDGALYADTRVEKVRTDGETLETVRRACAYVRDARIYDPAAGGFRPAGWGDIAVLCRTTLGCRRAYKEFTDAGIPAFLQGDMEIMDTPEAKILLAWMKFVENYHDPRGLVPILGYMGYSAADIRAVREKRAQVPEQLSSTRRALLGKTRRISDFIATVYAFHGIGNDISQAVAVAVTNAFKRSLMTVSEIILMMEEDMRSKVRYPVDGSLVGDAVTIQTVHGSKGLEYPIVIIPFMDANTFPMTRSDSEVLRYGSKHGIRCMQTVVRAPEGYMEAVRSWKGRLAVR